MYSIKNFTDNNDIKTLKTLGAFTVIEYQRDLFSIWLKYSPIVAKFEDELSTSFSISISPLGFIFRFIQ